MQTPIPVGPNPSLPAPIGPLSGFSNLAAGGGASGAVTAADLSFSNNAAFNSVFGVINLAAGKYTINVDLYVTSQAAASGGFIAKIVTAGTGFVGMIGSGASNAAPVFASVAPGATNPSAFATFDCSAVFAYVTLQATITLAGAGSIDVQVENVTNGITYTIKAGSSITINKVG